MNIKQLFCWHKWETYLFLDLQMGGKDRFGKSLRVCSKCRKFQYQYTYRRPDMSSPYKGYQPARMLYHHKWVTLTFKPRIILEEYFRDPRDFNK